MPLTLTMRSPTCTSLPGCMRFHSLRKPSSCSSEISSDTPSFRRVAPLFSTGVFFASLMYRFTLSPPPLPPLSSVLPWGLSSGGVGVLASPDGEGGLLLSLPSSASPVPSAGGPSRPIRALIWALMPLTRTRWRALRLLSTYTSVSTQQTMRDSPTPPTTMAKIVTFASFSSSSSKETGASVIEGPAGEPDGAAVGAPVGA
mmetsp:Transcript_85101/g.240973  ORF Transcript_85101/g.240973 Transcript_85101/m.240973 type:complete len:201 (+) Transcript_85101:273-875(+)